MTDPTLAPLAAVSSILDRLAPSERAQRLAHRDAPPSPPDLAPRAALAATLADLDVDATLAELDALDDPDPELPALRVGLLSSRAAQRYFRGEVDAARAEWEALIAAHPDLAAHTRQVRANVLLVHDDCEGAVADLGHIIAHAPNDADAYSRRGDVYLRMGRLDEARADLLRAVALDPDDLRANAGLGHCDLREGELARAIPWYTRAIRVDPTQPSLRVERALCYENLGRHAEALADLDGALALGAADAETLYARGRNRPSAQRAEALDDYTRCLAIDPDRADVLCARARARMLTGAHDEAMRDAERALALDPAMPTAWCTRGLLWHARGDYARAAADHGEAARLDPTQSLYASSRAQARTLLGDFAGVRADIEAIVALHPNDAAMQARYGKILCDEESFEAALPHLDAALAVGASLDDAARAAVHYDRATALRSLDRIDAAALDAAEATRLAPDVALYRSWLGMLRATLVDGAALAEADLTRAIALAPDDPMMRVHRALYYESLARWGDAIGDFDRVIELDGTSAEVFTMRAGWKTALGDAEGARADLERAVALGNADTPV
jgi:tetratricopeptide (TPR) repeat protein